MNIKDNFTLISQSQKSKWSIGKLLIKDRKVFYN